jgi:hypothetical protein
MSLWRQRGAIERAVAGQMSPEDEAKLRSHLEGCLECRRYYDAVTMQARILAGDPHGNAAASERDLARILGAMNPPAPKPIAAPAWWPRFAMIAGAAAALIFGLVSWQQAQIEPAEKIAWRGGGDVDAGRSFEVWVVTAPQDGGELRRDIAFPDDPVARVHANEWVAFAAKGQADLSRVVLINEKGEAMVLASGKSVALDVGTWRAFAVAKDAQADLADDALIATAREAGVNGTSLKLPRAQVSGVIIVQP